MDFRFTEDQQDLIDGANSFFEAVDMLGRLRKAAEEKPIEPLWKEFAEMGLISLLVPEEYEGLEQELVTCAGVAEKAGYHGVWEPIIDMAGVIVPLLVEINAIEYIRKCTDNSGNYLLGLITPLLPNNNYANIPNHFLVTSNNGAEIIYQSNSDFLEKWSIDNTRLCHHTDVKSEQNSLADYHGAVLTAAQLIGLSQRMVDMSVEYAKDRHQFGKAIGSFQAVKHQLANVYTQIEFTRPIIHLAAIKGGAAVHNAKVAAIDTAMLAAETAIQVHGGMGYTYEVDLHLFMKRAWALCGEWGDRNYHMKKLEDYVLDGVAELGPGQTFN